MTIQKDGRLLFQSAGRDIEASTRQKRRGVNTYKFFKRITKAAGFAVDIKINGKVHTVNKKSLAQYLVRISTGVQLDSTIFKKATKVALKAFEKAAEKTSASSNEIQMRGTVLNRYVNQTNQRKKLTSKELTSSEKWKQNFKDQLAAEPINKGGLVPPAIETVSTRTEDSGFVALTLDERIEMTLEQLEGLNSSPALGSLKKEHKEELLEQLQALQKLQVTFKQVEASKEQKALKAAQAHFKSIEKELAGLSDDKILYTTLLQQLDDARYRLDQAQIAKAKAKDKLAKLTSTKGIQGARNAVRQKALKSTFKRLREEAEKFEQSKVDALEEIGKLEKAVPKFDGELDDKFSAFQALLNKYTSTQNNFLSEIKRLSSEKFEEFNASDLSVAQKKRDLNQLKVDTVSGLKHCGIPLVESFAANSLRAEPKTLDTLKEEFDYSIKANRIYFANLAGLRSNDGDPDYERKLKISVKQVKEALKATGNALVAKGAKTFLSTNKRDPEMVRIHEKLFEPQPA